MAKTATKTQKPKTGRKRRLPVFDFTSYGAWQLACDPITEDGGKVTVALFGNSQGTFGTAVGISMTRYQWNAVLRLIRDELKRTAHM